MMEVFLDMLIALNRVAHKIIPAHWQKRKHLSKPIQTPTECPVCRSVAMVVPAPSTFTTCNHIVFLFGQVMYRTAPHGKRADPVAMALTCVCVAYCFGCRRFPATWLNTSILMPEGLR